MPARTASVRPFAQRRRQRGQAAIESVMVLLLVLSVFSVLLYYGYLGIAKLVGYHATFVTARSQVVGFHRDIVLRAKEVGTIGLAGSPTAPGYVVGLGPGPLGDAEKILIPEFVQSRTGYSIFYEKWPEVHASLPIADSEGLVNTRVWVSDYHMGDATHPMPFNLQDLSATINGSYTLSMYDHAAFYLK